MTTNTFYKKSAISLLALFSVSAFANSGKQTAEQQKWHDLSDPRAIYTGVSVAGGSEGVNISANYGSYLSSQFKQKITVEAMNDLDYYNVDYVVLNANTGSGFAAESSWNRDVWGINGANDTAFGVFAKIPLDKTQITIYPKLNMGMLWGGDDNTTTYIQFDATTRFKFNRMFWVGVTPTYTYAMKGIEINKWTGTLDAGVQLSPEFSLAASVNDDEEYWIQATFTF